MSSKTILKCDRCGVEGIKDIGKEFMLYQVVLGTTTTYAYPATKVVPRYPLWNREWCKKCCDEFHLLKKEPVDEKEKSSLPTLEDMVRKIVKEEIG